MQLHRLFYGIALSAIILIATHAHAQPVRLVCRNIADGTDQISAFNYAMVIFDESKRIAAFGGNAAQAYFGSDSINWQFRAPNDSNPYQYSVDRLTGLLTQSHQSDDRHATIEVHRFSCTVAQKLF